MKKLLSIILIFIAAISIATAQPEHPKRPTEAERLKHVTEKLEKELTLTASQKEKIVAAYKSFFAEMEKNKPAKPTEPPPPPPPVKKEIVEKFAKQRDETIKKVLTPEQFEKYVIVEKKMRPSRPQMPDAPKN